MSDDRGETASTRTCLNCGATLQGPFCAQCGQKHEPHPHTIRHFLGELVETLSHADSRLWRTLRTLVCQPGALTRAFFAGRREQYLPPLRLYLVASLLAFVAAGGGPHDAATTGKLAPPSLATGVGTPVDLPCNALTLRGPLSKPLQPRLEAACREATGDGGKAIVERLLRILPRSLFVLLPLVAAVMHLLWWRPRKFYVEHLVFLVHNHSALFLAFGAASLGMRFLPTALDALPGLLLVVYAAWYCWRSLRSFHRQSRGRTAIKCLLLGFAYTAIAALTLVGASILAILGV